jgi:hypothetical protein
MSGAHAKYLGVGKVSHFVLSYAGENPCLNGRLETREVRLKCCYEVCSIVNSISWLFDGLELAVFVGPYRCSNVQGAPSWAVWAKRDTYGLSIRYVAISRQVPHDLHLVELAIMHPVIRQELSLFLMLAAITYDVGQLCLVNRGGAHTSANKTGIF